MNKIKPREFWMKNKGKIIVIGSVALGTALVVVGYKKGMAKGFIEGRKHILNHCVATATFDKLTPLKDVLSGDDLKLVMDTFGVGEDFMVLRKGILISDN